MASPFGQYRIPFNRASFIGTEALYISEAVANGHISGDGPFTRRCEHWLEQRLGVPRVLLTTSCTHALEMTALLCDLGADDEVIVPSFTFVSTANAFALRGAHLRFADVDPATMNIDPVSVEARIGPRTRAVVAVNYAGVGCDMNQLRRLVDDHELMLIEDNAHGLFGRYRDQPLGTFGSLATQSFHETKNITCGEGGALVVNDPTLIERAEIIREKGTNRTQFFRGAIDKYTWVDLGSSYIPSDVLAAVLWAQLEAADDIHRTRRDIWNRYDSALSPWAPSIGAATPTVPPDREHPSHLYYLLMPSLAARTALIRQLKARGILATFHYQPLHTSEMGRRYGGRDGDCPVTEDVADRLVRLPLYKDLSPSEQDLVIEVVTSFN